METVEFEEFTFAVDDTSRTITGLVVPWEALSTEKHGRKLRFAKDSIKAVAAKFVQFFEDHNPSKSRGRAVSMQETNEGLEMTFKINDGPDGDKLLALAQNGVKTGLSLGAHIFDADIEPDPKYPGAFLVKLANLFEVSLVQRPSFNDARVITVMASADLGEEMDNETTPVADAATTVVETQPEPVKTEKFEAPAVIEPRVASTVVTEPKNYVFDASGNLQNAKYDFGLDLVQGLNPQFNDPAARARAEEFIVETFAAEGLVTSNVNELAPTRNVSRYIDKRDYRSVVFEAIRKGSVTQMNGGGLTPFTWPVFSSSSGLVAAGTEGEEPTVGTYVTTSATVTPTTLRGKAAISREMWDAGGVPNIGNVIWNQMVRDYQEALEAKIVATLDAASPTSLGTFTAGGGTTGQTLTAQMRSYLAGLNFVRGGFSMGYLFAQADLFTQLAGALDTTGRPILPAVGPTNTDGTARARWGSLDINGVTVLPAWALAAAGQTTAASSYLIDPTAVDGWADAPRRLFFDVAVSNVYLGIWGYAATVINDIAGVREVIYDPTA